jgi:hypothetical protein
LFAVMTAPLAAQCAEWLPGDGVAGVAGPNLSDRPTTVFHLVPWDADGAGPIAPLLVAAGDFSYAGTESVFDVAGFDPATGAWSGLGTRAGSTSILFAAALPNGDLIAERGAAGLQRWDGSAWQIFSLGVSGGVRAIAELTSGALLIGGTFTNGGGVGADHVGFWDGMSLSALGTGLNGTCNAIVALPSGEAVVAGAFTTAGGASANRVALWSGVAWSPLGTGMNATVHALALLPNGDLVAGGEFTGAGAVIADHIALWDGTAWSALGSGFDGPVNALIVMGNGDVVAGGEFTLADGAPASNIARWNGVSWSPLGAGRGAAVESLALLPNGDLVAGGAGGFTRFTGEYVGDEALARWNGTSWRPLGDGFDEEVRALTRLANGDVIAGGDFTQAVTVDADHVARFDGTVWAPLGAGVDDVVRALAVLPNGDLVAGGDFLNAGGAGAARIALWDGAAWSALGLGFDGPVHTLAVMPDGDLLAGGAFAMAGGTAAANIAQWDGASWTALGAGLDGPVFSLLVRDNGDVVVGGKFTTAGAVAAEHLALWDGVGWSSLNATWAQSGNVALGVTAMASLPDGDLVATDYTFGVWSTGQPLARVQRWDGTSWTAIATATGPVRAMSIRDGELAVGGSFTELGAAEGSFFARFVSTCPPAAAVFGSGCGTNTLAAASLPWVDATFRAMGSGLPDPSIVIALTGFASIAQGVLPISSLFPEGLPGCDLLVDPLVQTLIVSTGGVAESEFELPNTPPIVGIDFHHQMVAIELDMSATILTIASTNALQLVAGDF